MKIIYTDIYNDLTGELIRRAKEIMNQGKKIFYLVPSSLSFEKEKEILEAFSEGRDTALFDLTVSRFKQLPWYFSKSSTYEDKIELTKVGKTMLFKKIIKSFSKKELPLYFSMNSSAPFLDSLVDLHQEMEKSNLTSQDLLSSQDDEKMRELAKIIDCFNLELAEKYANYSKLDSFIDDLVNDKFTNNLQDLVIVIDGYSRFSAEEERLISVLSQKVSSLIIGTYASKESFTSTFLQGSVYQNSVEMMLRFKNYFSAELEYFVNDDVNPIFTQISKAWENENDPTSTKTYNLKLENLESERVKLWQAVNQKEEIEYAAKEIRQLVSKGVRYKDIEVLVGDSDNYQIKLEQIFSMYEIPIFYSNEESMRDHPLITLIENIIRLKRYNYNLNDVINLLKAQIYFPLPYNLDDVYDFEFYLAANNINGRKNYLSDFTSIFDQDDLFRINELREGLFGENSPLQKITTYNRRKLAKNVVKDFKDFLKDASVIQIMDRLYTEAEDNNDFATANRHQQVWDLMLLSMEEFLAVFDGQKLTMEEFLDLLYSGLAAATYRGIPANVDVVKVRDCGLVEPRSSKYVYVLGLSQNNFPKSKTNTTLLSDDDRLKINESLKDNNRPGDNVSKFIDQLSQTSSAKNIYNALSLFNSATEKLVLSYPQVYDSSQEDFSPYLKFLVDMGIKVQVKGGINLASGLEEIGNYPGLLANIGKLERLMQDETSLKAKDSSTRLAFWRSLTRILKNNPQYNKIIEGARDEIKPSKISKEVVDSFYKDKIYASVSSFENFYNCQYKYFINNTLLLKELETLSLDSRISGNYFHEVFERLMLIGPNSQNFDKSLKASLKEVYSERNYRYYFQNETGKYLYQNLIDIIEQTSTMLLSVVKEGNISPEKFEETFGFPQSRLTDYSVKIDENHDLKLRGKIDRIDKISDKIGIIDYKSGNLFFDLNKAFSGQSLQFMTYLDILRRNYSSDIWGASYLRLQNPEFNLKDLVSLDDLPSKLLKEMSYKGIFNGDDLPYLRDTKLYDIGRNNYFSKQEIDDLIGHNEILYKRAARSLLDGELEINPVADKSKVLGCEYCNLKAICKFEPNIHMNYTRQIGKQSREDIFKEISDDRA
ncbi:ATP-dependent nuclease subunit B [Streptococcaceae bacterium ESL0729]|nr:ATP-dependent nuclease subunit B [Streptococcaceae bacterium ESL0729]